MYLLPNFAWRNFAAMGKNSTIINAAEAAKILHISVRAVQHRITSGTLPAQKLPGKTGAYILDRETVEAIAAKEKAA